MHKIALVINGKKIWKSIRFRKQKAFRNNALLKRTQSELKAQEILERHFVLNKDFSIEFWFQFRRFDFFFPLIRTVIEIDGGYHFTEEQMEYDRACDLYFKQKHKLKIIRIKNENVESSLPIICQEVKKELLIKNSNKAMDFKAKIKSEKKKRIKNKKALKVKKNIYYKVIDKIEKPKEIKVILRKANSNLVDKTNDR